MMGLIFLLGYYKYIDDMVLLNIVTGLIGLCLIYYSIFLPNKYSIRRFFFFNHISSHLSHVPFIQ